MNNSLSFFGALALSVKQQPVQIVIMAIVMVCVWLVFAGQRRLRQQLAAESQINRQLMQQVQSDNTILHEDLNRLAEAFVIRSERQESLSNARHQQFRQESELNKNTFNIAMTQLRDYLYQQQHHLQESHTQQFMNLQQVIAEQLKNQTEQVRHTVDSLNNNTENRLKEISSHVNQQLEKGFSKTQTTFTDIQKRLSVIDEAQKRIDHLSTNVVSLQNVLTDKKARGAFGEMQLQTIVENALPPQFVDFQYTLSNGRRADCIIHLPEPNGDMVIDAKFPLESYRQLTIELPDETKTVAITKTFKRDIKKHITDIASKYILPPETAESAILFMPAEAIFAEIHANHGDLVEFAQRQQVWIASPTTLMAILATAKSVIKDDATRRQAHIMREQLHRLKEDFERFQSRMDGLAKRIEQAGKEATDVSISAGKISKHFQRIDAVDTWDDGGPALPQRVEKAS